MNSLLKISSVNNISVFIHWTFLLLVGWIFIANLIIGINFTGVVWSLFFLAAIIASVVLHELGHALVAAQFDINAKNIILLPIGGIASIEKFPKNPAQEIIISAGGPAVNFLIAMILSVFIQQETHFWNFNGFTGAITADNILEGLFVINLLLALLNLIPAFPMDGGRMLRAVLGFRFNYIKATSIVSVIGKVVAAFLIVGGIILLSPLIALVGIFIISFASKEEHYLRLKGLVKGMKLKDALIYDYNSLQATMTISHAANVLSNNHSKYFIVMDDAAPVGTIKRYEIFRALAERQYNQQVGSFVKEDLTFLDANINVEEVLDKLAQKENMLFPVMENNNFIGVVNFQNIIEYLLIHKADTQDYVRVSSLVGLL